MQPYLGWTQDDVGQHLIDFNFKEVRDGVVKLRHIGQIMTGPVAICCECGPSVFEELNNLRVSHFETSGVKLSKLGEDVRSAGVVARRLQRGGPSCFQTTIRRVRWEVVWDIQRRIVDAEHSCCLSRMICSDSKSLPVSMTSCSNFQLVSFKRSVSTRRIRMTGNSGTYSLPLRTSSFCKAWCLLCEAMRCGPRCTER